MKNIFFSIRKRTIIVFLLVFIFLVVLMATCFTLNAKTTNAKPMSKCTVVIDAGHGGIDGGCTGKITNITESELNLKYAINLSSQLNEMNISNVLTRQDSNGLYDSSAKNLKRSDMKRRKDIIEKYQPNLVVSIHMNSFPISSVRGAQVFYKKNNNQGKILADCVQFQLNSNIEYAKGNSKVGDYYILNCTEIPAILIECGFLSNAEEENLLISKNYQTKLCYAILSGIVCYLNT